MSETAIIYRVQSTHSSVSNSSSASSVNGAVTTYPIQCKLKRGHVSKACTNCRKMHAGCDRERPCSRCVFNGWDSTCVDTPRKKRISKKTKHFPDEKTVLSMSTFSLVMEVPNATNFVPPGIKPLGEEVTSIPLKLCSLRKEDQELIPKIEKTSWVDGESNSNESNPFSDDLNEFQGVASLDQGNSSPFLSEKFLLSEVMDRTFERRLSLSIPTIPSTPLAENNTSLVLPNNTGAYLSPLTTPTSVVKNEMTFGVTFGRVQSNLFVSEISELREKNRLLETRVESLIQELNETRDRTQQMAQLLSNILMAQQGSSDEESGSNASPNSDGNQGSFSQLLEYCNV